MTDHDMDLYAPYDNCGSGEPEWHCRDCINFRLVEMGGGEPDIAVCDTGFLVEADPDDEACNLFDRR